MVEISDADIKHQPLHPNLTYFDLARLLNLARCRHHPRHQSPILSIRPFVSSIRISADTALTDGAMLSARSGSVVLPEWQDDSEVSACPICKRNFHFLFRKHHCRRCGRIICDQCSPHRITLPRQYIVRPPWEATPYRIDTDDNDDTDFSNPALGGGETVRVCNPCVPDPNYGPPPQQQQQQPEPPSRTDITFPPYDYSSDPFRASTFHSPQRSPDRSQPDRYRSTRDPSSPTRRPPFSHHHSASSGVPASAILEARFRPRNASRSSTAIPTGSAPPAYALHSSPQRPTGHRRPVPVPVREEDECPVCGTHAPPFGPAGDLSAREAHIEACLASHLPFGTPRSGTAMAPAPTAMATPPVDGAAGPGFNAARLPRLGASPAPATVVPGRARGGTHTHLRMLAYLATEKDCRDDAGEGIECVICLDDFEPGQEMGRLECLCKFHRACIRGWWESGPGRERWGTCPTHALSV